MGNVHWELVTHTDEGDDDMAKNVRDIFSSTSKALEDLGLKCNYSEHHHSHHEHGPLGEVPASRHKEGF